MLMLAAAAAVEGLVSREEEVAEVQAVGVEGVRMTGCCYIALLTGESTVAVVACRYLHSVVGCM